MRALKAIDLGFLTLERRETPMHVGALLLFSLPDSAPPDHLRKMYEAALQEQIRYPFNQKLAYPPSRVGLPHWVQDNDFDAGYHLRHSALPYPGRYRELFALISRLHGSLLDRSRPLWEAHVIEGLRSNEFALYVKVHHALIDGVGAMRMLQRSLSEDPARRNMPIAWSAAIEADQRRPGAAPSPTSNDLGGAVAALGEQLGTLPGVWRALSRALHARRLPQDTRLALPFEAPQSPLNTHVTGARRFVAQSYSVERIQDVGRAYGATVNDVVLAMCASALRRYLEDFHGGAPARPLIAMVPVSVRPSDGDAYGNALTAVLVNLGTHVADPLHRFEVIRASMADAKSVIKQLSFGEVMLFTALVASPVMAPALVGLGAALPSINVVISNVPGPKAPLYWNGSRLAGMYPASILFHGMALNITLVSNTGVMDFGITACRRALPRVQRLIDFLEDGLTELESLTTS